MGNKRKGNITRREALTGLAYGIGALGLWPSGLVRAEKPQRVAVLGAGAGGVCAAYFLDDAYDVDVFEARDRVGGHCHSVPVEVGSGPTRREVRADLGAAFFHPDTHPMYVAMLEELGLRTPQTPERDPLIEAKGSLAVFDTQGQARSFVSHEPIRSPIRSLNFAFYTQSARNVIEDNKSYEISIADWVDSLYLTRDFKENLLLPWLTALIGTNREKAMRASARAILQTFALSFPDNFLKSASTFNSKVGLDGHLLRMMEDLGRTTVRTNHPVEGLQRGADGRWSVLTSKGRFGPYDHVVINAQPQFSKHWFRDAWAQDLRAILDRYEYFDARIVIHRDPVYMLENRKQWCVYNAGINGQECEGSVWVGGIHEPVGGDDRLSLFKSWSLRREKQPQEIVAERTFNHPLITPDAVRAARELANWQGVQGIWFSGQHTTGMDLQEAALYSAMRVAKSLNPDGARLARFETRLRAQGKDDLRYDP